VYRLGQRCNVHLMQREALTPAQECMMRLVCDGMSTAQMCAKLRRSHWTIRNHLRAVFKAYRVHSRVQLVVRIQQGG